MQFACLINAGTPSYLRPHPRQPLCRKVHAQHNVCTQLHKPHACMQEPATFVLGRATDVGAASGILGWWQECGLVPLLARAYNMAVQVNADAIALQAHDICACVR